MKTLTIKSLQVRVNEIVESVNGLNSEKDLRAAQRIALQDETIKGLMADIINEALAIRWHNEQQMTISRFIASARKQM